MGLAANSQIQSHYTQVDSFYSLPQPLSITPTKKFQLQKQQIQLFWVFFEISIVTSTLLKILDLKNQKHVHTRIFIYLNRIQLWRRKNQAVLSSKIQNSIMYQAYLQIRDCDQFSQYELVPHEVKSNTITIPSASAGSTTHTS